MQLLNVDFSRKVFSFVPLEKKLWGVRKTRQDKRVCQSVLVDTTKVDYRQMDTPGVVLQ